MKKFIVLFVCFIITSCYTTVASSKKPIENTKFKIGNYYNIKTRNQEFYGKIDSIANKKIYLTNKKKAKIEINFDEVVEVKKLSAVKTVGLPILIYGSFLATGILLIFKAFT